MPNDLSGIVTTRVDLVKRAALRDPRDKNKPASFLLYKAEGVDVKHAHAKAGGGSFTHEHPITAAASHGHGEDAPGNDSGAQLLPLQNEALRKADPAATDQPTPTTATDPQGDPAMPNATETDQQKASAAAEPKTDPAAADPATDPKPSTEVKVEINKSELAPEVRAHIERLEKSQQDSSAAVTEARAAADRAEALAKSERDARLDALYKSEAATFTHLPIPTELHKAEDGTEPDRNAVLARALRQLDEQAPEAAKILRPMLTTTNEALAKSQLFGEKGSAANTAAGGSTTASVAGKVADLRKSDPTLSDQQAAAKVYEENPDLFEALRAAESGTR